MALVIVVGLNVWWFGFHGEEHPLQGESAPGFTLDQITHGGESTNAIALSDHRGKIVLIDFWATHCGPCKVQMPVIQRVYDSADKNEVSVISVNLDFEADEERRRKVSSFIREGGFTFPVVLGHDDLLEPWHIKRIPFLVVVDKRGQVAKVHTGLRSEKNLRADLEGLAQ